MHLHFVLNTTQRHYDEEPEEPQPKYTNPSNPAIQIAVHSPYFLPSPVQDGINFIGGRAYDLRLKMNERHLLPSPYQTHCTDYMKSWMERGGKAPINQMGIIQECRVNKTYESRGCVPVTLNYPHSFKLCKTCDPEPCNFTTFTDECGKLADNYTQPCESITYTSTRENRVITTYELIESNFMSLEERVRQRIAEYPCEGNRIYRKECGTIDVHILFEGFEITNLTYNAKFESLELFSVIGGYMGMWLGISLLTVYDFIGSIIVIIKTYAKTRKTRTKCQKLKTDNGNGRFYRQNSSYQKSYTDVMDGYRRPKRTEVW